VAGGDYVKLTPGAMDAVWVRLREGYAAKPTARQLGLSQSTVRDYLLRCGGIRPDPRRRAASRAPGVACDRGGEAAASVVAAADRWLAQGQLPRRPGDAGVAREHLPHPVRPGAWCVAQGADRLPADRSGDPTYQRSPSARRSCGQTNTLHISQRPAEAEDRAVPGHWEGDLVFGNGMSPVATVVERTTRFLMLVALPDGNHKADAVADASAAAVKYLPTQPARSLTWDLGHEMAEHQRFTIATGIQVYFCDPRSPWQRGSNENTNGLLRQYLPRRVDFRTLTQADLDAIAQELNERPRQTLGFKTPSQALAEVLH
jgi:hypothetical protein